MKKKTETRGATHARMIGLLLLCVLVVAVFTYEEIVEEIIYEDVCYDEMIQDLRALVEELKQERSAGCCRKKQTFGTGECAVCCPVGRAAVCWIDNRSKQRCECQ